MRMVRLSLLVSVLVMVIILSGCNESANNAGYKQIKIGQTPTQVVSPMGKPDSKCHCCWHYDKAVFDMEMIVCMDGGQVASNIRFDHPEIPTP